jgi:hypothetical protein
VGFRGRRPGARNGEEPTAWSSVKKPSAANDDLIGQTIGLWQPFYRRELSREDARQLVENVTRFFSILHEWSRAENAAAANDKREQATVRDTDEACHER